jgi:hypothetical protein
MEELTQNGEWANGESAIGNVSNSSPKVAGRALPERRLPKSPAERLNARDDHACAPECQRRLTGCDRQIQPSISVCINQNL